MSLIAYGHPLMEVYFFKYLGSLMSVSDYDWPSFLSNLRNAWKKWDRLSRVMEWEGVDTRTTGNLYMALVQAVLLFGLETLVISPRIGRILGGYRHQVVRRMMRQKSRQQVDGSWVYPPLDTAMVEVVLEEVEKYVYHRQNTVAQLIANIPIMYMCLAIEQRLVAQVSQRCWEQTNLDLEGMRAVSRASDMEKMEED